MRRKDREITDKAELLDILRRCDTVRLGMVSEGEPYVVPLSFGVEEEENGSIAIYFHCAQSGRKVQALQQQPRVCIEGDIFYKTEPTRHGITTRYESIIGFGTAEQVDGTELRRGLESILRHYGYDSYPVDSCKYLPVTAVYKITLSTLSGKRNLPEET